MATQKGRNWSSGDIVTAANLSSIERGVSAVAEEYTPTTWANGNTVTAAGLNNIEQGLVNASGSSDFSTATVELFNGTGNRNIRVDIPFIGEAFDGQPPRATSGIILEDETSINAILYKGYCIISVSSIYAMTGTGSIATDGNYAEITGDCTITISNSSGGQVA